MLLQNNPEIINNLSFNLSWINDHEIKRIMYEAFRLHSPVFCDPATMTNRMQLKIELIRERYNRMYYLLHLEYNPLDNYSMYEYFTNGTTTGETDENTSSQYPENVIEKRPVANNSASRSYNDTNTHYLRRRGNIGVTTSAQMIEGEMRLLRDIVRDFINEFNQFFVIKWEMI